jgi:hypothetical protein
MFRPSELRHGITAISARVAHFLWRRVPALALGWRRRIGHGAIGRLRSEPRQAQSKRSGAPLRLRTHDHAGAGNGLPYGRRVAADAPGAVIRDPGPCRFSHRRRQLRRA